MSQRYVGLNGSARTHIDTNSTWPCCRGMSLACSSVVMDTPRHIRHPISRGMLSASEGLAPRLPPTTPPFVPQTLKTPILYPLPPKTESPSLILPEKPAQPQKGSLLVSWVGSTQLLSCPSVWGPPLLLTGVGCNVTGTWREQ